MNIKKFGGDTKKGLRHSFQYNVIKRSKHFQNNLECSRVSGNTYQKI